MERLVESCIDAIRNNENIDGVGGGGLHNPTNPSIIVNFNLANEKVEDYKKYLRSLWIQVYNNIQIVEKNVDFEEVINRLRGNTFFNQFNIIYIHILVDLTDCKLDALYRFIEENFNEPIYNIILHEFLDYSSQINGRLSEENLLKIMRNRERITYQLVYSNELANGALWLGDNASKILRLAANITAIMIIDAHYFSDGNVYTFSYNLLEKPTKNIIQVTIKSLLDRLYHCPDCPDLDQNVLNEYGALIRKEVINKSSGYLFKEDDFMYLPDNDKLQKEKKGIKKSIDTLKNNYPITETCFRAMIDRKIKEIGNIDFNNLDFLKEPGDNTLLSFFSLHGYIKGNRTAESLIAGAERGIYINNVIPDEGSYSKILMEYSNNEIKKEITKRVFEVFSNKCREKINNAESINEWLSEYSDVINTQIARINIDETIRTYYKNLVDGYFNIEINNIIEKIDGCINEEELKEALYSILVHMFNENPIYFKSFEDEVDERLVQATAARMFEEIGNQEIVDQNMCIYWANFQSHLNKVQNANAILLINPNSSLLKLNIPKNYNLWKLSRQDCVERIDFHILSLNNKENS